MGRLGAANVSIAAAFCIAYLLRPSRYLLPYSFFNVELLKSFGLAQANLVLAVVNYWPLAFAMERMLCRSG